jgi:hypothetical protein
MVVNESGVEGLNTTPGTKRGKMAKKDYVAKFKGTLIYMVH